MPEAFDLLADDRQYAAAALPAVVLAAAEEVTSRELECELTEEGVCVLSVDLGSRWCRIQFTLDDAKRHLVESGGLASGLLARLFAELAGNPPTGAMSLLGAWPPPPANAVETTTVDATFQGLLSGRDVHLVGESASGKSIAAGQVARRVEDDGWPVYWVDLREASNSAARLLASWLSGPPPATPSLVVLDDVQVSPAVAKQCLDLVAGLRGYGSVIRILVVGWPASVTLVRAELPAARMVTATASTVLAEILESPMYADVANRHAQIEAVASGDLLVARAAIDFVRNRGEVPDRLQVASHVVDTVGDLSSLSVEGIRLLHWLACLGGFEIEADTARANRRFRTGAGSSPVEELLQARWVRQVDRYVSVGHRSLASAIQSVIESRYSPLIPPSDRSAVDAAVGYLKGGGDSQILLTLDRLDLSAYARNGPSARRGESLARSWAAATTLSLTLAGLSHQDPTWGDNTASACFSATVHFALGQRDHGNDVLDYVRSRWNYGDGVSLPKNVGNPTADRVDFDEILNAMRVEDGAIDYADKADGIDADRFHRTWALGLLLGLEDADPAADLPRQQTLRSAASAVQLPNGSFYPSRVPWITARVVLGLVAMGDTALTSPTVRRAVDWLRRPGPDGPLEGGRWRSGTGAWNSDVMTTSMVVLALVGAGVPTSDEVVRSGVAYLLSRRNDWLAQGGEIDGALAVEAALAGTVSWTVLTDELEELLRWAQHVDSWRDVTALASDSHTESSKAPFVASSLVSICWRLVKRELPLLLTGVVIGQAEDEALESNEADFIALRDEIEDLVNLVNEQIRLRETQVPGTSAGTRVAGTKDAYAAVRQDLRNIERSTSTDRADVAGTRKKLDEIRARLRALREG